MIIKIENINIKTNVVTFTYVGVQYQYNKKTDMFYKKVGSNYVYTKLVDNKIKKILSDRLKSYKEYNTKIEE